MPAPAKTDPNRSERFQATGHGFVSRWVSADSSRRIVLIEFNGLVVYVIIALDRVLSGLSLVGRCVRPRLGNTLGSLAVVQPHFSFPPIEMRDHSRYGQI